MSPRESHATILGPRPLGPRIGFVATTGDQAQAYVESGVRGFREGQEDNALTGSLKNIRTRLNPFSPEEQGHLINWGYALTDAGMRRHVIPGTKCPPATWPIKDYPLDTS